MHCQARIQDLQNHLNELHPLHEILHDPAKKIEKLRVEVAHAYTAAMQEAWASPTTASSIKQLQKNYTDNFGLNAAIEKSGIDSSYLDRIKKIISGEIPHQEAMSAETKEGTHILTAVHESLYFEVDPASPTGISQTRPAGQTGTTSHDTEGPSKSVPAKDIDGENNNGKWQPPTRL